VKSDRRHFKRPREPLARSDTGSECITSLICYRERWRGLPALSRSHPDPDRRSGEPACHTCIIKAGGGSVIVIKILRPEKVGFRMTNSFSGNLSLGNPPSGFSELDVGRCIRSTSPSRSDERLLGGPPGVECDFGLILDELVSSGLETTRLIDDEVHHGYCFTMDRTRFLLCQN
jgi:hypothetical protein